jgi:hypothetical protein
MINIREDHTVWSFEMQNKYDEYNNDILTTLYESYLSKFIIENPQFYCDVFKKINHSIMDFIDHNRTASPMFDRYLYSVFSQFNQIFPEFQTVEELLGDNLNLQAQCEFHKQFFETIFSFGKEFKQSSTTNNTLYSLSELIQLKVSSCKNLQEKLSKHLRPDHLFSDLGRSRSLKKSKISTQKFGITSEAHVPVDLQSYYKTAYKSAQLMYKRNEAGLFSNWLSARNLPFVAGPSGTIEIIFCHITKLDTYTSSELKKYFMALAAAHVSRGNHSFAEEMVVAKQLGFSLEDMDDRRSFYEQILTQEVIESQSYQDFLDKHQNYIEAEDQARSPIARSI